MIDLNYMAETGLLSMNRWTRKTSTSRFQLADIAGVVYVGFCLHQRTVGAKNGKHQYIDVSLFDATVALGAIAQGLQERPTITNANFKWLPG
jgi:crotonobetainyl-CoA:carnitine CoA-transferase CaiB-like acyl-CoA transferase